jgi:hypothetical protein
MAQPYVPEIAAQLIRLSKHGSAGHFLSTVNARLNRCKSGFSGANPQRITISGRAAIDPARQGAWCWLGSVAEICGSFIN